MNTDYNNIQPLISRLGPLMPVMGGLAGFAVSRFSGNPVTCVAYGALQMLLANNQASQNRWGLGKYIEGHLVNGTLNFAFFWIVSKVITAAAVPLSSAIFITLASTAAAVGTLYMMRRVWAQGQVESLYNKVSSERNAQEAFKCLRQIHGFLTSTELPPRQYAEKMADVLLALSKETEDQALANRYLLTSLNYWMYCLSNPDKRPCIDAFSSSWTQNSLEISAGFLSSRIKEVNKDQRDQLFQVYGAEICDRYAKNPMDQNLLQIALNLCPDPKDPPKKLVELMVKELQSKAKNALLDSSTKSQMGAHLYLLDCLKYQLKDCVVPLTYSSVILPLQDNSFERMHQFLVEKLPNLEEADLREGVTKEALAETLSLLYESLFYFDGLINRCDDQNLKGTLRDALERLNFTPSPHFLYACGRLDEARAALGDKDSDLGALIELDMAWKEGYSVAIEKALTYVKGCPAPGQYHPAILEKYVLYHIMRTDSKDAAVQAAKNGLQQMSEGFEKERLKRLIVLKEGLAPEQFTEVQSIEELLYSLPRDFLDAEQQNKACTSLTTIWDALPKHTDASRALALLLGDINGLIGIDKWKERDTEKDLKDAYLQLMESLKLQLYALGFITMWAYEAIPSVIAEVGAMSNGIINAMPQDPHACVVLANTLRWTYIAARKDGNTQNNDTQFRKMLDLANRLLLRHATPEAHHELAKLRGAMAKYPR